jgi:hypothetical protein
MRRSPSETNRSIEDPYARSARNAVLRGTSGPKRNDIDATEIPIHDGGAFANRPVSRPGMTMSATFRTTRPRRILASVAAGAVLAVLIHLGASPASGLQASLAGPDVMLTAIVSGFVTYGAAGLALLALIALAVVVEWQIFILRLERRAGLERRDGELVIAPRSA